MEFDFSDDCPPGGSLLAYGVALAGFTVSYEPNYSWMGSLGISLVPYRIGRKVYATASAVYNDFSGDLGRVVPFQQFPLCSVQATALALVGTSIDGHVVLGNRHGVGSGEVLPGIQIGSNLSHWGYVAGFSFTTSDPSGSYVSGLSYSVQDSVDGQESMTLAASASTPSSNASGTLDLLALSLPDAVRNFEVKLLSIPFAPAQETGLSGDFSATFNPPPGKSVTRVGLLQQGVDLVYQDNQYVSTIQASFSGLRLASPTLKGTYRLDMGFPFARVGASSGASIYAIAQFG